VHQKKKFSLGGNLKRDLHRKHGKVDNAPVVEIQPEASLLSFYFFLGLRALLKYEISSSEA